jgi:hypothetical protein
MLGGGANIPSLMDAQKNFSEFGASTKRRLRNVRAPKPSERIEPGWRTIDAAHVTIENAPEMEGGSPIYPPDYTELYYWRGSYWRKEEEFVILWRPVGPEELQLIRDSGMRAFPPRLPEQPIFYPVLSEEYAIKIARDWNVPASGRGYVTRFRVLKQFLDRYEIQDAGGSNHREYWIPAEELSAFNAALVGKIEVIAEFP